jgi:hypothetical protein
VGVLPFLRILNVSLRSNGLVQKNIIEFKLEFKFITAPAHALSAKECALSTKDTVASKQIPARKQPRKHPTARKQDFPC